jgi:large subunit ribosomal protein L13
MIIDGSGLTLGRLASFAAKQLLQGEPVTIVNCNEVVMRGNPEVTWKHFMEKIKLGTPQWGPFITKTPAAIMRRSVKGMLPAKHARGRTAYRTLKCHSGLPDEFRAKITEIGIKPATAGKSISLAKVCEKIGGKKK